MSYLEQIEQCIADYPLTAVAKVPSWCGVTSLPAYPHIVVQFWAEDICELQEAGGGQIASFRLVG